MRIVVILTLAAVLVTVVAAVPAMAQKNPDKAAQREAKRAAKRAAKQAQNAAVPANNGVIQNPAPAASGGGNLQNPSPAGGGVQKALPYSSGIPAGDAALLGAGALFVGSGILIHASTRRRYRARLKAEGSK